MTIPVTASPSSGLSNVLFTAVDDLRLAYDLALALVLAFALALALALALRVRCVFV
eukprot:CAMPEP_0183343756 /NCGR_PEP_ID=MMETSP0164_2-20130417/9581_1 /TAXON_ID=221442 /ORGANISM="Coccolithus pelagicus ssp braarudi, Strain PLY182g" /LENGTH=55 /DNA_ID=CAMNT_0025514635 /DNA_START=52 /DNA_END=219 /DNA_ORIENTATION=+